MQTFIPFDRKLHVYSNAEFSEIVKDAVRFFTGTPVQPLSLPTKFFGTGVYAIYYIGKYELYRKYAEINRIAYNLPIYVGKAVPKGWRQSRVSGGEQKSSELYSRLRQHATNINSVEGIVIDDFCCRFVIFEEESTDMIGTIEAALIKIHTPLWNSVVDGFGNHDPGNGRYNQAISDWDVLHPGRKWVERCQGTPNPINLIESRISEHLDGFTS